MRRDPFGNILHVRMHYKSGRYWYVYRNQWKPLAKDYPSAMQEYAAEISPSGGMARLINETYRSYEQRVQAGKLSQRSLKTYKLVRERIDTAFVQFAPSQVKPSHIASFIDFHFEDKPNMGNIALVVLTAAFKKGVRWGLCDFNPAKEIERLDVKKRDRLLSDAEYSRIYAAAPSYLKQIMDMCYLTGQRIGDVLLIKQADISTEGIYFRQQKTQKRLLVESSTALSDLVKSIRTGNKVAGVYLFAKTATQPYHYESVRRHFSAACVAAGVEDARLHDIRAKAATDADAQGLDAQGLMGHSTAAMTKTYLRLRQTSRVKSPAPLKTLDNL